MKKCLIFLFFYFSLINNSLGENIILTCNWDNDPQLKFVFHIDPEKNQLVQFNNQIQDPPALANVNETTIFIAMGRPLDLTDSNERSKRYNDNILYELEIFYWGINRYSGQFEMHSQIYTNENFEKKGAFISKQRKSGYENAYYKFWKYGEQNDGPGSRLNDTFSDGVCKKASQKF